MSPAFDADETEYTATTRNNTNTVTATALDSNADVAILLNSETAVTNGTAATWAAGENTLEVTVTNGSAQKVYTVAVTKS